MSDPTPETTGHSFGRRDFLKVGGAVAFGLAGAKLVGPKVVNELQNARDEIHTGIDWTEASWGDIDFVDHPELLIDNPSAEKRIAKDLTHLSENVDGFLQRTASKHDDPSIAVDLEKYRFNALGLMQNTVALAGVVVRTKERGLMNVLPEVGRKYAEYATYLHAVLRLDESDKKMSQEEFDIFFEHAPYVEALADVVNGDNSIVDEVSPGLKRSEITAHWPYQWRELINGGTTSNPLITHYLEFADESGVGGQGRSFINVPKFGEQYLPRTALNLIEKEMVGGELRPLEPSFVNIDPELQKIMFEKMKALGLERTVRTIGIDPAMFQGVAYSRPVSGDVFLGVPLDLEIYTKYSRLIDHLFYHETFHILKNRAAGDNNNGLSEEDYLEFRNLELELIIRFDPLVDMKKLFNPSGEYVDLSKYDDLLEGINDEMLNLNEMTLDGYYFQHLDNLAERDRGGRSVQTLAEDLRVGLMQISGMDLGKYFSVQKDGETLDEIFSRLESQLPYMDSVSVYIARTILDYKDDIVVRKRPTFTDEKSDGDYFANKVVPYTLAHIGLYKFDELTQEVRKIGNPQFAESYVLYWQLELERFVRGSGPAHEFIADLFSEALIDEGRNIEWGNSKEICLKMVDLLRRNSLAFQGQIRSTV
jgi:hypothetical protein